jgi:hypothetical protein
LENRFIYNKLEAILFEEMLEKNWFTMGNREIYGKFALNIINVYEFLLL